MLLLDRSLALDIEIEGIDQRHRQILAYNTFLSLYISDP
jgi:hypothetical protein